MSLAPCTHLDTGHVFKALWPIVNEKAPVTAMFTLAARDVPDLARRAHARITGPGQFTFERSVDVPGSGRVTEWVLVYTAPAVPVPRRSYHHPVPPVVGSAGRDPDDVDHAVVARVLAGEVLDTTRAERRIITATWVGRGRSETALCDRMGWRTGRYLPSQSGAVA
jgi:hypothetical protein